MKRFFKNFGFTLFELLAVLAIMAIIASIAVPRVMQTIKNARIEALESNMALIRNSVQRYCIEQELTDCVGFPFVIHPTQAERDTDTAGVAGAEDKVAITGAGGATAYIDTGAIATALEDYIEGGIPAYIRVAYYHDDPSPTDGNDDSTTGTIEVTYGLATLIDGGEVQLTGGLQLADAPTVESVTFDLDTGSTGHDHTSPDPAA